MNIQFKNAIKKLLVVSLITVLFACGGKEERKAAYLEKGKAYLAEKNYKKAKIEFKNVLQIDPKFAEAYFYMGQLEEENKELRKALGLYKKAIELNSTYTEAKVKLATIYVIAGTKELVTKAKELLLEAKRERPDLQEVNLISEIIRYKEGNKQDALSKINKIVQKDKSLYEGIVFLATGYMREGKIDEAEKVLKEGIKNNPSEVVLRTMLVKLYLKNKNYNAAEDQLKASIEIEPEKYKHQLALSNFYVVRNQLKKAEDVLRKAIKDDDEDVKRYLSLVEFLSSKVSVKKAVDELKLDIDKKPELYDLQFALSEVYEKTGNVDEAKTVLQRIMKEKSYDPEGIKAKNKLATILFNEGDYKSAKKYISQIIEEHPNNNDALLTSGKLYLRELDAASAINALRTVVKNEPDNTNASMLLAKSFELNNESLLAENELKRSIESNPVSYKAHLNYANYLVSKKRYKEALDVTDKALSYFNDNYDLLSLKLKLISSKNDDGQIELVLNAMKRGSPQKYEVNYIRGKYFLSKKEFNKALAEFNEALVKTDNKYPILEQIVKVYLVQNKAKAAVDWLNKRLTENSSDAASQLLLGKVYLYEKKVSKAKDYINRAIDNSKEWVAPYETLAAISMRENNISEAINVYKRAINNLKNKVPFYIKMASLYEKNGNHEEAINAYNKILIIDPNNKLAINNLASLLLDFGSKSDIEKAMRLVAGFENIKQPALRDSLGWAYAKSGDYAKAINVLKPIVEKLPDISVFKYHLGYALYYSGDKAAAKRYLKEAISSGQDFTGKDEAVRLLNTIN